MKKHTKHEIALYTAAVEKFTKNIDPIQFFAWLRYDAPEKKNFLALDALINKITNYDDNIPKEITQNLSKHAKIFTENYNLYIQHGDTYIEDSVDFHCYMLDYKFTTFFSVENTLDSEESDENTPAYEEADKFIAPERIIIKYTPERTNIFEDKALNDAFDEAEQQETLDYKMYELNGFYCFAKNPREAISVIREMETQFERNSLF